MKEKKRNPLQPKQNGSNSKPTLTRKIKNNPEAAKTPTPHEVIQTEREHATRMKLFVPYWKKEWIELVKKINGRAWNKTEKYWSVPMNKKVIAFLKKEFGEQVLFGFAIPEKLPEAKPLSSKTDHQHPVQLPGYFKKAVAPSETANKATPAKAVKPATPIQIPPEVQFAFFQKNGKQHQVVVGNKTIIGCQSEDWINAFVPHDKKGWIETVKNVPGRKWVSDAKCWQLPYVKTSFRLLKKFVGMEYLKFLFRINPDIPEEIPPDKRLDQQYRGRKPSYLEQLMPIQKVAITLLVERLKSSQYSRHTVKAYKNHFAGLLLFYKDVPPEKISIIQFQQYVLHLINIKQISESTQNQVINAVKFYWEKILGRDKKWIDIPRPRKPQTLPDVLSQEEIIFLINTLDNIKHKFLILLIYSAGLRKGEATNLRVSDMKIQRRSIFIRKGKGKKDRYVVMAESLVGYFQAYMKQCKPTYWLFEGQTGGQYSGSSVHNVFTNAKLKSGINPFATVHTLRHSYTTHCLENGFDLKLVQEALGHGSIKTTERYLHLTSDALKKLKSPPGFLES